MFSYLQLSISFFHRIFSDSLIKNAPWGSRLNIYGSNALMQTCDIRWSPRGKNRECPFLRIFGYCPCPLGEMMKFSIIKWTTQWKNRALQYPTKLKNREFLNFVFLFSQLCKIAFLVFPLGASGIYLFTFWHRNVIYLRGPDTRTRSHKLKGADVFTLYPIGCWQQVSVTLGHRDYIWHLHYTLLDTFVEDKDFMLFCLTYFEDVKSRNGMKPIHALLHFLQHCQIFGIFQDDNHFSCVFTIQFQLYTKIK